MIMGQAATETFGAWLIAQGDAKREDAVGSVGAFWRDLPDRAKIRSVAGVMKHLGEHPDWQRIQPALDAAVHEFRTRGARPLATAEAPPGPPGRSPYDQPGPDAMQSPFGPVQAGVVQPPPPGQGQPVPPATTEAGDFGFRAPEPGEPYGWRDGGRPVPVTPADEAVRAAQERAAQWRQDPQTLAQPELPFPPGTEPSPQTLPYPEPVMRYPEPPVNPAAEARRDALMSEITPEEIQAAKQAATEQAAASIDAHLGLAPGTLAVWTGDGWAPVGMLDLTVTAIRPPEDARGAERPQERLEEAFADREARQALAAAQRRQDGYLEHAQGPPPHHNFAALAYMAEFEDGR